MQKSIPLFPLNLVAFPGEKLKLHIFEDRYKEMIKDCVSNELSFGIVTVIDKSLSEIGTEMKVTEVAHIYPDGKMDIVTRGQKVFELMDFQNKIEDKLYPGGEVHLQDDIDDSDLILLDELFTKVRKLYRSMNMKIQLPPVDYNFRIYEIAHKIGMNTEQELKLLGMRSEIERLKYGLNHLDDLIPVVTQMEQMRKRVQMNGHFRDALPPDFTI